jgi:hypothetical protein
MPRYTYQPPTEPGYPKPPRQVISDGMFPGMFVSAGVLMYQPPRFFKEASVNTGYRNITGPPEEPKPVPLPYGDFQVVNDYSPSGNYSIADFNQALDTFNKGDQANEDKINDYLTNGADTVKDGDLCGMILLAARRHRIHEGLRIIDLFDSIPDTCTDGRKPLEVAIASGSIEFVNKLLEKGAVVTSEIKAYAEGQSASNEIKSALGITVKSWGLWGGKKGSKKGRKTVLNKRRRSKRKTTRRA